MLNSSVWRDRTYEFSAGLAIGGSLTGAALGVAASVIAIMVDSPVRVALTVLAVGGPIASCLIGKPLQLPQRKRIIEQDIISRRDFGGPFQFGVEMGTGLRTFLPSPLAHVVAFSVLLLGDLFLGIVAGLAFGVGRALMPVSASWATSYERWEDRMLDNALRLERIYALAVLLVVTAIVHAV